MMKTDKPLLAILLAMTAGLIIEPYTMLMKHYGFTNITALETLSFMMQREPSQVLGITGTFGIFAWDNLLLYYSANFWGTKYFPLKGMLLAMTGESLTFNIFGVLGRNELMIQNVSGNFVHASAAAIAGLWVGFLYQKYLLKDWQGNTLKTDKPLLAILIGWAGWPFAEGLTQLGKHFNFTGLTTMEAASLMWLTKPSLVLGILSGLGLGAWIGLFIYYSANLWGTDYFPIKASLIMFTCLSLIFQVFGVLGGNELLIQSVSGAFIHASGAVLAGITVGFLMKKYLFASQQ